MVRKDLQIVVWGATGFTGQLVAEYLARSGPAELRWAIAGRDERRLGELRRRLVPDEQGRSTPPPQYPEVLVGDSFAKPSLDAIAARAEVVISTVGPYFRYGLPLVEACVEGGAHYVDLTGEALFVRQSIDRFHTAAAAKRLKIVHCCGFDSVPSDLCALLVRECLEQRHGAACGRVEYVVTKARGGVSGGTIASVFTMLDSGLANLRRTQDPYMLNPPNSRGVERVDASRWIHYNKALRCWVAPGMMAAINNKVVRRSAAILGYGPHFQYDEFTATPNVVVALLAAVAINVFTLALLLPPVRWLARKLLPKPGQGPSAEAMRNGFCRIAVVGTAHGGGATPPATAKALFECRGDPGYSQTAVMIAESALCLALQHNALPARGGVLTPASAFGHTLVERLRAAGMTVQIAEDDGAKRA